MVFRYYAGIESLASLGCLDVATSFKKSDFSMKEKLL